MLIAFFFSYDCDILLYMKNPFSNEEQMEINYNLMIDQGTGKDNYKITWVEQLNNWNRNKYGIICNTFSFFVSIIFGFYFFWAKNI